MEKLTETEKVCGNCLYFSQHYVKLSNALMKTSTGHCKNETYGENESGRRDDHICGLWEDGAAKKQKRRRDIKKILRSMSDRLADISMILKDDDAS